MPNETTGLVQAVGTTTVPQYTNATAAPTIAVTATAPPTPPATPAPAAPPPPAPKPADEANDKPPWLDARLEQAKHSILKELGITDVDEGKRIVAAHAAKAEAEKTAEQRAAEMKAKAEQYEAQSAARLRTIAEYAARQMVGLTAEQQGAVKAIAGDDAEQQLKTIAALAPTWAKSQSTQQPPPPANSAPPPNAPPGTTASPTNARSLYEATRNTNPFLAAIFGQANPDAYRDPNAGG